MNTVISVIGSGSWGTALAISLSKKGFNVRIWGRDKNQISEMESLRVNKKYLPDIELPQNIKMFTDIKESVIGADVILLSVSSQSIREVLGKIKDVVNKKQVIVNTSKGIEKESLKRVSEIVKEELDGNHYVVLSGPSHAEEVCRGLPTTLVAASTDKSSAQYIQDLFISSRLRVYTNPDVIGVELGGTLKNIIALCAGISDGLGFGDNAKAALMTRGIVEISKLGSEMGAYIDTFSGLTGIGDLIVTCTSMHSRNRRCGIQIGKGKSMDEAVKSIGMVVEGIVATEAAYRLSKKYGIEMPITEELYNVLYNGKNVKESVTNLMMRNRKHEMEHIALEKGIEWK